MGLLRGVFGPSKDEIWSQIAKDIGGEYIDAGFWGTDVLKYRHGEWEILLDTYTVSTGNSSSTYTRMRTPFINSDGLRFEIYREGFFSSIGKLFKMQDIQIGDASFDHQFIIKGNNEEKLKLLLQRRNTQTVDPKATTGSFRDSGRRERWGRVAFLM